MIRPERFWKLTPLFLCEKKKIYSSHRIKNILFFLQEFHYYQLSARFTFCLLIFHTFTFFELYFWILCPGPPEINTELKNQSVTYNSTLQLVCSLGGFPTPDILWTKDGVNLRNNNTLTIRQARFEDSGQYTCSAKNSEGKNEAAFHIRVTGNCWLTLVSYSFYSLFLNFFFILSPFLNCTFEFYGQVLLKLILSLRISRLPITRRFSSFALQAVSLQLRYSGLRMGWISVTKSCLQALIFTAGESWGEKDSCIKILNES